MSKPTRRTSSSQAKGLYRRQLHRKGERTRDVGAFVLDMRIKDVPEFAGIPKRIARSTEVFPGDRDAERRVREMKAMVKELIRDRDAATLKRIQDGSLSLASAYKYWKTGRLNLAYGFEGEKLLKLWRDYYAKSPFAYATKKSRNAALDALVAHGLLTDKHPVNDLPTILGKAREHYQRTRRHHQYNTVRTEAMAFARRKLGVSRGSPFFQALWEQPRLKLLDRREHHPFDTPRDFRKFLSAIEDRETIPTPSRRAYMSAAAFMCLHGLRPEEFERQQFEKDRYTGHLRIKGSKNANAKRVVPMLMLLETGDEIPAAQTLNRTFEHIGLPVRCRDFRRTYAIWCEKAGVPANRLRVYMGHASATMTHLYQRVKPTREMLDEDHERLEKWFNAEFTAPEKEPRDVKPMRTSTLLGKPFPSSLKELVKKVKDQQAEDARHAGPEGDGDADEEPLP